MKSENEIVEKQKEYEEHFKNAKDKDISYVAGWRHALRWILEIDN